MTQAPPHEMIVKMMMKTFVLCVVTNAPPQFVCSTMRSIALNALTLTLVGMKLCMLHHNSAILLYIHDLPMLQYTLLFPWNTILGRGYGCRYQGMKAFLFARTCPLTCHSCLGFLGRRRE